MDAAFDSAAFALPLNTLSQPVLSQFGYHLIEITSRKGDKAKGRHILIPIEVAGAHRDQLDAQADSLEKLGGREGRSGGARHRGPRAQAPDRQVGPGPGRHQGPARQARRAGRRGLGVRRPSRAPRARSSRPRSPSTSSGSTACRPAGVPPLEPDPAGGRRPGAGGEEDRAGPRRWRRNIRSASRRAAAWPPWPIR